MLVSEAPCGRLDGDRRHFGRVLAVCLLLLLLLMALLSLSHGASGISAPAMLMDWLRGNEPAQVDKIVLLNIRLPRMLTGILVGGGLAMSGTLMQGLFRNPLADPALLGVTSGASLGAIAAIVLGAGLSPVIAAIIGWYLVPLAAFIGGWCAMMMLYGISTQRGRTSVATMLLGGIALAAMISAVSGLLIYIADDQQLRDVTFWGLGSLSGANWPKLAAAAPLILATLLFAPLLARGLNGLALGEAVATHIGINVQQIKTITVLAIAAATGAAVAVSGGIGFVGIVVPHLLRLIAGPDHRWLLVNSALLGGSFLLLADMICRTIIAPAELPIGIITAMIGGPFFMWVLLSNRRIVDL